MEPRSNVATFNEPQVTEAAVISREILEKRPPVLKCSSCRGYFNTTIRKENHFSVVHVTADGKSCRFCSLKCKQRSFANFGSQFWLSIHEPIFEIVALIQRCTICGAVFYRNKSALKRHLIIHSDIKQFKCEYCEAEFADFHELKSHVLNQVCWQKRSSPCVLSCYTERKMTGSFRQNFCYKHSTAIRTKFLQSEHARAAFPEVLNSLSAIISKVSTSFSFLVKILKFEINCTND